MSAANTVATPSSSATTVSVIIPNLDCPTVDRAVRAVLAQQGARADEILIVGRDAPDRLSAFADHASIRHVDASPRPPGAARNLGAALATGDLLVFVDADCEPEPGWLAAHLARHAAGATVVGGGVLWDDANYWTLADNISMFHPFAADRTEGPRRFLPSLNLSVARRAWEAAGGMDPVLRSGEDVDFTARLGELGHPPLFAPEARVWHRPPRTTASAMLAHWHRSGRWMIHVRRAHPAWFGAPGWLYHRLWLVLMAPLIAAAATRPIYRPGAAGARHLATLPAVYATKLAWCAGAAHPVDLAAARRAAAERGIVG